MWQLLAIVQELKQSVILAVGPRPAVEAAAQQLDELLEVAPIMF